MITFGAKSSPPSVGAKGTAEILPIRARIPGTSDYSVLGQGCWPFQPALVGSLPAVLEGRSDTQPQNLLIQWPKRIPANKVDRMLYWSQKSSRSNAFLSQDCLWLSSQKHLGLSRWTL